MSPARTVMRVNQALIRRAIESRFVTMLYGVLEDTGRLTYCNAGHNAPFVVGPARTRRLETGGPPVGLFDGMAYEEETIALEPGEWVAVFSDGVSEALSASGDEFGEERIKAVVEAHQAAEPADLLEALLNGVREFTIGATQNDDVTTLLVRYRR